MTRLVIGLFASAALSCVAVANVCANPGDADEVVFRSARWGVTLEPPNDYLRGGDSPYPGILARWSHPSGVSLSLSAQPLGRLKLDQGALRTTPRAAARKGGQSLPCGERVLGRFAKDNLAALSEADYVIITPARTRKRGAHELCRVVVAPVRHRRDGVRVHQAYLVSDEIGYVLTLTLPAGPSAAARASDLELALDRLELAQPVAPKPALKPGSEPAQRPLASQELLRAPPYPDLKPWLPWPLPAPARKETPEP